MSYVIPPAAPASVPVVGRAERFAVHRIYCVGRNYAEHAREMGFTGREPPFFFMKPADAVLPVAQGETGHLPYPTLTQDLHHEIELVVAMGKGGRNIAAGDAMQHIWGYAVGLDMTRRDLQAEAKKQARPWDTAKGFDQSAPITSLRPVGRIGAIEAGPIWLAVNGERRQASTLDQLIWDVPEILHELSKLYALRAGDLVFMGTPAGVAALQPGDAFDARIGDVLRLQGHITPSNG